MKEKDSFNILILGMIVNLVIGFGIYFYLVLSLLVTMRVMTLTSAENFWIAIDMVIVVAVGVVLFIGFKIFIKEFSIKKILNDDTKLK